jgi:hypothetical protein
MLTLDKLSPPALEAVCDEFERMGHERGGARGVLKRAWASYVQQKHDDVPHRDMPLGLYARPVQARR